MPVYTPNPTATQWPTNFQGCKLTGQFLYFDGTPVSGQITLTPAVDSIHDLGAPVTIEARAITITLDVNGRITELDGTTLGRIIPATDDPDVQENGWTYSVTYSWKSFTHSITAPQNTTLDLSTVPSVAPSPGVVNLFSVNPVVVSAAYAATITPAVGTSGASMVYNVAALTGNVTIANPTGTPTDGQSLRLRMIEDATGGRTTSFGTAYAFGTDVPLSAVPTAASAKFEVLFTYYAPDAKWRCVAIVRGF